MSNGNETPDCSLELSIKIDALKSLGVVLTATDIDNHHFGTDDLIGVGTLIEHIAEDLRRINDVIYPPLKKDS